VAGCVLVQASSPEEALKAASGLLPNRVSQAKNIDLSSKVDKVPDNLFHRLRKGAGAGAAEDNHTAWSELLSEEMEVEPVRSPYQRMALKKAFD